MERRESVVQLRNTRLPKSPSPATIVSESPIFITASPPGLPGGTFQGSQCFRVRHSPRSRQQRPPPKEAAVLALAGGAEGGKRNIAAVWTLATSSGTHRATPFPATASGCSRLGKSSGSLIGCKRWGTTYGCGQLVLSAFERPLRTAGETARRSRGSVARAKSRTESRECTTYSKGARELLAPQKATLTLFFFVEWNQNKRSLRSKVCVQPPPPLRPYLVSFVIKDVGVGLERRVASQPLLKAHQSEDSQQAGLEDHLAKVEAVEDKLHCE